MKLVFVDIDNTLLDFDAYTEETLKKGFEEFHLGTYDDHVLKVFHQENDILWERIEKRTLTFEELKKIRFEIVFERLGIDFDGPSFETYFRSQLNESAIVIDGAYSMLDYLKKKYILAVSSNGPYQQQMHRLFLAHMEDYFTYFFISEKVGYSKPDKRFFEVAFDEINQNRMELILPSDSLIIGDSLTSDMQGGINYGIHTCLFDRKKKNTRREFDYVIENLRDASKIL